MRRGLAALVAVAIMIVAIPATAEAAFYQRWVATRCSNGKVLVERYIDHYQVLAPQSCPSWTEARIVNGSVKYYTWNRPELDLHMADYFAHAWWGHCQISWSGVDAKYLHTPPNWYFTRFDLRCP